MVLFIKPGPINGIEARTEYGCGHSGVLAQSPMHPLPEPITFRRKFRTDEEISCKAQDFQLEHTFGGPGTAQQLKRGEAFKSADSSENVDDRICPNMANKEFIAEFNEIRDKLIKILTNSVIPSVSQWGPATRERAMKWFGTDGDKLKQILLNGYPKCVSVLKQISGENFVKPTKDGLFGCVPDTSVDLDGVHAAVCPLDTGHHIAIYPGYCNSRTYSSLQGSKIGTILHEVCHFQSTFTSIDHVYDATLSERLANTDPSKAIGNTDNFVMFALHG